MYNEIEKFDFIINTYRKNEEVKSISKKQNRIDDKDVFLCKHVDYRNLGREIYADNVDTPFSFYLIRELKLAKDYQNLAGGEAYFEEICDSWDAMDDFDDLVVKKIYLYVETEVMYYSLYIGSFKATRSDLRFRLKEWLANVNIEKKDRLLTAKDKAMDLPEMQNVMKQLLETSNEIFRLKRIINDLNTTLENERMEKTLANEVGNSVISRSIRTIHLKRAQPLILEDEVIGQESYGKSNFFAIDDKQVMVEATATEKEFPSEMSMSEGVNEKKLQAGLAKVEPIQKNTTIKDRVYVSQEKVLEGNEEFDDSTSDPIPAKLRYKKFFKRKTEDDFSQDENEKERLNKEDKVLDQSLFVLKKKYNERLFLKDRSAFLIQVRLRETVPSSIKPLDVQQKELKKMEDDIYLHFMNKRVRGSSKKSNSQKVKIARSDLFMQITQASYLHYSWGQVLRRRNKDLLICNRLSSAHLVSNLDYFLSELKSIGKQRSFFRKKVSCSSDMIRRLEGYILMDQYMQKLSMLPVKE